MKRTKTTILVLLLVSVLCAPVYASGYSNGIYPVYRAYNPNTGEHLYTSAHGEATHLETIGWRVEGVAWYSYENGENVYRLFNTVNGDHLYTMNPDEINNLVRSGVWTVDYYGMPAFGSGHSVPVYRLYAPRAGRHLFTQDLNEYNVLTQHGWVQEGVAFYAASESELR